MTDILSEIEKLMTEGYSEEDAEICVALLNCSNEELSDLWEESLK